MSINRLNDFFKQTDLLDAYGEEDAKLLAAASADDSFIGFRNATFTWNPESPNAGTDTPSQFRLTVPGELQFKKGKINLIVGPTYASSRAYIYDILCLTPRAVFRGSGKTSLLMALLGEMHFSPTQPDSTYSLPRAGGVSFAVQESWVLNQTIRDNIIFNSLYDEDRYKEGTSYPLEPNSAFGCLT